MKKLGFALISLMFVVLLAGSLEAKGPDEWSGEIDLPYAYRSGELTTVLNGGDTEMDSLMSPLITLDMKWELKDKVFAFLQIENQRVQDGNGTVANAEFGGGDNINVAIEQAYIKVEGFMSEKLNFTIGIQDLKLALRKGEGAFFCDVAGANATGELDTLVATVSPVARDVLEFGGLTFNYGSVANDNFATIVFWGNIKETGATAGIADDKVMGVNLDYKLPNDEKNVVKVLVVQVSNAETDANIMTIGVGADYFGAVENLEIYGEIYSQTGDTQKDVDQKAQAFRVGGRYSFQQELKPYVDLSYWSLSGDPQDKVDENTNFISYENVQSTLILEDNLFGLDLDSNYTAIKVEAGIETSLDINKDGTTEPISLKLLLGQFTMNETFAAPNDDDALGTEIDLIATLHYTENLSFTLAIGSLTGADFFDQYQADTDAMTFVSFGTKVKF